MNRSTRTAHRLFHRGYTAALNNMALFHSKQGRYLVAEGLLQQALELEPDSVISLTNLGLMRYRQGKRAEAVRVLRKVAPPPRPVAGPAARSGQLRPALEGRPALGLHAGRPRGRAGLGAGHALRGGGGQR